MRIAERKVDNNFTLLRLMLALLVVLGHFKSLNGEFSAGWPFGYAASAVCCFFVVSGYLISDSFDRDPHLGRFYIRRIFRVYPLYIAVVVAQTLTLGFLAPGGFTHNISSITAYFFANAIFANFLVHDIGSGVLNDLVDPSLNASLWTLKIEFAFYLILPLIWIGVKRYGPVVLIGLFILSAFYYWGLLQQGNYQFAKQLPGQLQFFILGVAAYRYRDRIVIGPVLGMILTIVTAAMVTVLQRSFPATPVIIYPAVVAVFVVMAALKAPHFKMRTDISYGVYLVHAPIIQLSLLFGIYRPDWIGLAAVVLVAIVLAMAAERWIEAPGIAAGKWLAQRTKIRGEKDRSMPPPFGPGSSGPVSSHTALVPAQSTIALTVVVVNDFCYVQGGASKVAIDEAISLARAGVRVVFFGAVGPPSPELRAAPLELICLDQRELLDVKKHPMVALQGLWNTEAERRLREVLLKCPKENTIVHLHGYTKAMTSSPVRAARRLGVAVICTLHDFFSACPNGAFFDYGKNKPCSRRALSPSCISANCDKRHYVHKIYRVMRSLIERSHGRFPLSVGYYICLSKRSAAILKPYLPARSHLHMLENPMDWQRMNQVDAASSQTILYVGRLDAEKGVELLAQTAAQLGLSVKFVGEGPLRSAVEGRPSMTVTGWVARDDVRKHISQARCLVFSSLWYETYGLVVAEAAAHGVPSIISDVTAAAERIVDGSTGWLFRSGDPDDLARCLKLVGDDALVKKVGDAAYQKFWENASTPETHTAELLKIYRATMHNAERPAQRVYASSVPAADHG